MKKRAHVLSIAGFDPSAGAGVLADIKTFEALEVYGFGVVSALTYQNEDQFFGLRWISKEEIFSQLDSVFSKYSIDWVKVGIIESLTVLEQVIEYLKGKNKKVKVIWDPIIKSSSGYRFHDEFQNQKLKEILPKLYLITPNQEEILSLSSKISPEDGAKELSSFCHVLLKGGHGVGEEVSDILFEKEGREVFKKTRLIGKQKHGSGCVYSAALVSGLAKGESFIDSCKRAQEYSLSFLASNDSLLGYHVLSHEQKQTENNFFSSTHYQGVA